MATCVPPVGKGLLGIGPLFGMGAKNDLVCDQHRSKFRQRTQKMIFFPKKKDCIATHFGISPKNYTPAKNLQIGHSINWPTFKKGIQKKRHVKVHISSTKLSSFKKDTQNMNSVRKVTGITTFKNDIQ